MGAAYGGTDAQPGGAHAWQTAAAHQQSGGEGRARVSFPDLSRWNRAELRAGYSVNRVIGLQVGDRAGKSIGKVDDLLVNNRGRITAVVIQSGGFMGIGDRHSRVAWNELQISAAVDSATAPVRRQHARSERETHASAEDAARDGEYRVKRLLNGSVESADGTPFGKVDDLIIGRDGQIKGLVADAGGFGPLGRYAFPYRPHAHDFDRSAYRVPYDRAQIGYARPFDYTAMSIAAPAAFAAGVTTSRPNREEQ